MRIRRTSIQLYTLLLAGVFLSNLVFAKSCLWKVTSETGTLYVQGSIHLLKPEHYPLAPEIEQAYAESKTLILEVDMAEMSSPNTQQKILQQALLPSGKTLRDLLSRKTYQQLADACTQAGMPIATIERFKPWFAATTLTLIKTQNMGFAPQYGLDTYFFEKAKSDSKKVIGLETVSFQIDLFESLSKENPDDFVTHTLAELNTLETDMEELEAAWLSGNIEELGNLMLRSFEDYPELYNTFVLDRNKRWLEKLDALLKKSQPHMVVVGAGHLPGKGGLLELLGNKGYTIEQW
jgi:uncharacterized protein YbaP (TraB family)